ncbi:MAG: DUF2752 domain-containing protein [Chitinophagaceae bacterium]|nr:DUF2752 domain-containing protein [Chitinophagaceae bacterium]
MVHMFNLIKKNFELIAWVVGLSYLFFLDISGGEHFTLCFFRLLGFEHCPGCGIGRSIHCAMHLDWSSSWYYHWLGIPALGIIIFRIITLLKNNLHGRTSSKPAYDHP